MLLLVDVRLRQVDQRRRIDVDVAIAGIDRQAACAPDLLGHRLGVVGVFLGVELVVVALDEDRPLPARGDGAGQDRGRIVDRALERVGLLAAGEFEDHRRDVGSRGRLVDGPGHVEGLGPQVERRDREAGDLAAGAGLVQGLDARRACPELLARLPDEPLRGGRRGLVGRERRGPGQLPDAHVAEGRLVIDDESLAVKVGAAGDGGEQLGRGCCDAWHLEGSPVGWPLMVATRSEGRLDDHQEDDDHDQSAEEHPATPDPLGDRYQLGGGGPGGVPGGGGVEVNSIRR